MNYLIDDIKKILPPLQENDLEIVVIGNEDNSGEAILIHIPNGRWILIDSCKSYLHQYKNMPLSLYYLKDLRRCEYDDILYVVCTHWHKDHTEGLSDILANSQRAKFVFNKYEKNFMQALIKIDNKTKKAGNDSLSDEFLKCVNRVTYLTKKEHKDAFAYANIDRELLNIKSPVEINVSCLSPVDANSDDFDRALLSKKVSGRVRKPNDSSVVISVKTSSGSLLFGGDLERFGWSRIKNAGETFEDKEKSRFSTMGSYCQDDCGTSKDYGWCGIKRHSVCYSQVTYDYVKIPHHGSSTGYCPSLFTHCSHDVIGVTTCFSGKVSLPSNAGLNALSHKYKELYVTTQQNPKNNNVQNDEIAQYIKESGGEIDLCKEIGIVVTRKTMNGWETQCFGNAWQYVQTGIEANGA